MKKVSPHSPTLIVSVGAQCHVGLERSENQDRITRAATPFGDLFMVADGVGGYQGGAEAAELTVDGFSGYLNSHGGMPLNDALQEAARGVSAAMMERGAADPARYNMGSTVVLFVIAGTHVTCAHAGDSRGYLIRNGKMLQLTRDHSVTERLVSQGVLDPARAREHPDASVLTMALGRPSVALDISELELEPGDGLLLCSDGLWAYSGHSEMETIAASPGLSATGIADALLNLALEGGGGDNISVQYLRFEAQAEPRRIARSRRLVAPAIALASLLAVATGYLAIENYRHPVVPPGHAPPEGTALKPAQAEAGDKVPGPGTSDIVIIQDPDGSKLKWDAELKAMPWLKAPRTVLGSGRCLELERDTPLLYFAAGEEKVAKKTAASLREKPRYMEISAGDLYVCDGKDLVAMPGLLTDGASGSGGPKSHVDAVGGAARKEAKRMQQELQPPQ